MWLRLILTILLLIIGIDRVAIAAVLLFERGDGSALVAEADLSRYGDRIAGVAQEGFKYGLPEGPTANVVVELVNVLPYGPSGYGDLVNVLYRYKSPLEEADFLEVKLTADAGYHVQLHAFDIGTYSGDQVLATIEVLDETGKALFSEKDRTIAHCSPATHDTIRFDTPLQGQSLTIRFNEPEASKFKVGLDNIVFSQTPATRP